MKTYTATSISNINASKKYQYVFKAKNFESASKIANDFFDLRFCTVEVLEGNHFKPSFTK